MQFNDRCVLPSALIKAAHQGSVCKGFRISNQTVSALLDVLNKTSRKTSCNNTQSDKHTKGKATRRALLFLLFSKERNLCSQHKHKGNNIYLCNATVQHLSVIHCTEGMQSRTWETENTYGHTNRWHRAINESSHTPRCRLTCTDPI